MSGRNQPSLEGSCGATSAFITVFTAEVSAPRLQLIGAFRDGLEPVKSASISEPRMRTTTLTAIGSSVAPSPSTISSAA